MLSKDATMATRNSRSESPSVGKTQTKSGHKTFFLGKPSFDRHVKVQNDHRLRYMAGFAVLVESGAEIPATTRVRALAASWARSDKELATCLLDLRALYGLPEVLKALCLLDAARASRALEKHIEKWNMEGTKKHAVRTKVKTDLANLNKVKLSHGSVTGSVSKQVKRWVRGFTLEELEFFAFHHPTQPWKKLADICHLNPKKDFPQCPWFLRFCFGEPPPEESVVHQLRMARPGTTADELVLRFNVPYTHAKKFKDRLSTAAKVKVASSERLDTVLWYYEDLRCDGVDEVLWRRLVAGEDITLNSGKLFERMLMVKMLRENIPVKEQYRYEGGRYRLQEQRCSNPSSASFYKLLVPIGQRRLDNMSVALDSPVVVIGDRSQSMEIAVRTSTIIAAIMAALTQAKLVFFNSQNTDAPEIPRDMEQVLELAVSTRATGGTAPAASLYPFYQRREVVRTFILVTDEEENRNFEGFRFGELFKRYSAEVFPAKLILVSFLRSQHEQGQMTKDLVRKGLRYTQFVMDQVRPDLSKLSALIGLLMAEADSFRSGVKDMETKITTESLAAVLRAMTS